MVRDFLEPLVRDSPPARDVAKEGDDVILPLRTSEAGEQNPVIGDRDLDMPGAGRAASEANGT